MWKLFPFLSKPCAWSNASLAFELTFMAAFHFLFALVILRDLVTNGLASWLLLMFFFNSGYFLSSLLKSYFSFIVQLKCYLLFGMLSVSSCQNESLSSLGLHSTWLNDSRYNILILPCNMNHWMCWILKPGIMSPVGPSSWLTYSRYSISICWNETLRKMIDMIMIAHITY